MKRLVHWVLPCLTACLLASCGAAGEQTDIEIIPAQKGEKFIFVDREGNHLFGTYYDYIQPFFDGLAVVRIGKAIAGTTQNYYFINTDGEQVINMEKYADFLSAFKEGKSWVVKKNSAPIAINKQGEELFEVKEAESVRLYSEDRAAFSNANGKWGFLDEEGKVCIEPTYEKVGDFHYGKAWVVQNGKYGYIEKDGSICINPQFEDASRFNTPMSAAAKLDDKWGVINTKGRFIVENKYRTLEPDGKFYFTNDDGFTWIDNLDSTIIKNGFSRTQLINGGDLIPVANNKGKWGYVDWNNNVVINPQFDGAAPFMNGRSIVKSGKVYKMIDRDGLYCPAPPDVTFTGLAQVLYQSFGTLSYTSESWVISSSYLDTEFYTSFLSKILRDDKIDDYDFNTTLAEINAHNAFPLKSGETTSLLWEYNGEVDPITEEKFDEVTFKVFATAIAYSQVSDGWFGYNLVLNSDAHPLFYEVDITPKKSSKMSALYEAVVETLSAKGKTASSDVKREDAEYPTYDFQLPAYDAHLYVEKGIIKIKITHKK